MAFGEQNSVTYGSIRTVYKLCCSKLTKFYLF